ncbi:MAG: hypothetical protein K6F71_05365 [Ruminococcus sp.]|uniref:hypothetical protein n=1 Tax=Ruminococcus sp. TaxID=41978 RepID=UPI0025DEEDF6|nr:hypothetical protein [Ruminococcus sp.]MCR5540241.1 hypothetical protein [Ruminococcus sp.]
MNKTNTIKRLAAAMLALVLAAPAFLTKGTAITASAEDYDAYNLYTYDVSEIKKGNTVYRDFDKNEEYNEVYGNFFTIIDNATDEVVFKYDSEDQDVDWIADKDYVIVKREFNEVTSQKYPGYYGFVYEFIYYVEEVRNITNIDNAEVTVDTDNGSVSVALDDTEIDADAYDVEYIKQGETTGTSDFPTEAGRYTATVTAKTDSDYEGNAVSEEFIVNGKVETGKTTVHTNIDDTDYTSIIYTVNKDDVADKRTAQFILKSGVYAFGYNVINYYSSISLGGITYSPEDTDSVMFILTLKNATPDDFDWDFYLK